MLAILKALYHNYFGLERYNLCLLGIQKTGKTTFYNSLKHIESTQQKIDQTYKPTIGLNTTKFNSLGVNITLWDLGGKKGIRNIWENYYPQCHGFIFFIGQNIEEEISILKQVVMHQEMMKIPFAVIAENHIEAKSLIQQSEIFNERVYKVYKLNLKASPNKYLIKEIIQWLYSVVSQLHQEVKSWND